MMELYEETDDQLSFAEDVSQSSIHYCQDGGMECIDEMIAIFGENSSQKALCLLNVWEVQKKGSVQEWC